MPITTERTLPVFLAFALASLTASCGGSDGGSTDPGWEVRDTTLLPPWEEGCTNAHVPIVMAHGFLASGDTYANHLMRFTANGYCRDRIFVYDWNSLDRGDSSAGLDAFVDEVLLVTGATQIDLMGHSAGGGVSYTYLEDATRAQKVRRYVHIGSGALDGPAGPTGNVPTLNLYSANDRVVTGNDGIDGAENVDLVGEDHYEVATSAASFTAIWEFLTDTAPTSTDLAAQEAPIVIAGRGVSLGENVPTAGATIDIYEVDADTGRRRSSRPRGTFTANAQGYWGPFAGRSDVRYEFHITPVAGRSIHYYRENFVRSNTLVYLRTLPTGFAGSLLVGSLRFDEDQPTTVIFLASRGLQPGDMLSLDDADLSGDRYTNRDETNIALFFFDNVNDDATDLSPVLLFESFPFLVGVDFAPGANADESSVAELNGRRIGIPRWPAASDGVSIAVFD